MNTKSLLIILVGVIVLGSCAPQLNTEKILETSTPTATSIPVTPSQTPLPSETPTPTPVPISSGTIILGIPQVVIPEKYPEYQDHRWFSVQPDGTNLIPLDKYETIYSVSPDGKFMLVRMNEALVIAGTAGDYEYYLPTDGNSYIPLNSVLWLKTGKLVLLASERAGGGDRSIYVGNWDGSDLTKLAITDEQINTSGNDKRTIILFDTFEGDGFYWVDGYACDYLICEGRYYLTKIDGSEQTQVWENLRDITRVYPSPSREYFAYYSRPDFNTQSCILATVEGRAIKAIGLHGNTFCGRGVSWSPKEDLFIVRGWNYPRMDFQIWDATGKDPVRGVNNNAANCGVVSWLLDGEHLLFSRCIENPYPYLEWSTTIKDKYIGPRIVNVVTKEVIEFPSIGECENYSLSPDGKWGIFVQCHDQSNPLMPLQILNLETKELYPILEQFASKDPNRYKNSWVVRWIP